ncbi:hypothetical protein PanWU01x14_178110 [Parasponia andersonii]|uniref:Uncharacterized protein n=1 Tax=Parasponia andersonii TaxID=3476 RepID=A0A2P5C7H3_PARAD|nr:hypothetical protein PanWU01x14_178110 [Parasponia andersonii]
MMTSIIMLVYSSALNRTALKSPYFLLTSDVVRVVARANASTWKSQTSLVHLEELTLVSTSVRTLG